MNRRSRLLKEGIRVVVLDDDPTGIQTVQGCLVLTEWSQNNIAAALRDGEPYFFILTNTRAFAPAKARKVIADITRRVVEVNADLGHRLVFISRSDSTLRGHFPLEMDTVIEEAGIQPDARFLIPAFFEGNRLTVGDTHYIVENGARVPCHETEFSRDPPSATPQPIFPNGWKKKPAVACTGRRSRVSPGNTSRAETTTS